MSHNPSVAYRPDIDGLRAVAVLAVVFHHLTSTYFPGGYIGVDVFFVISGYLITKIIAREIAENRFSFSMFYERRIRRIFPALFAVIGAVLVAGYFLLLPSDYIATIRAALGTIIFSSNIVFWHDLQEGYFAYDAKMNPLLHMWSLGVEEQFYVIFPLLLLVLFKVLRRHALLIILLLATASLLIAAFFLREHSVAVFFLLPFRAWELLVGSILALSSLPVISTKWKRELISFAGISAIILPIFLYDTATPFPAFAAIPPVVGAAVLIYVGAFGNTSVRWVLQLRPVVYIGLISYSLYLWHWPIIVFAKFVIDFGKVKFLALSLLLISFIISIISYHLIEKPIRSAGKGLSSMKIAGFSIFAVIIIAVTSLIGLSKNGYEKRFSQSVIEIDRIRKSEIPYINCEVRKLGYLNELCIIGDFSKVPTILLWGDSHLLSWLPAFNVVLMKSKQSAYIAPNSGCPPILELDISAHVECKSQNIIVMKFLKSNPQVRTIIISGFWSKYFTFNNFVLIPTKGDYEKSLVTPRSFINTITNLNQIGKHVVIMGPVPTYKMDVPLALAQSYYLNREISESKSLVDVYKLNHRFYETIYNTKFSSVEFVDVATWMCQPRCKISVGIVPIYRDSNHLSLPGSLEYTEQVSQMLRRSKLQSKDSIVTTDEIIKLDIKK